MAQIFHRSTNTLARVSLISIVALLGLIASIATGVFYSYGSEVEVAKPQPVPFSHKHHVNGLGIDCRYCHTSVEETASAGIPPTQTCMTCHSQIWSDSPMLEPVRASYRDRTPLQWNRVHDLPDFVYFNHSIHISKGIGCTTCHGQVDQMPLIWKQNTLFMEWCLDCHRHPEKYIRPKSEVFSVDWRPPADQLEMGARLVEEYRVRKLDSCSTCHR